MKTAIAMQEGTVNSKIDKHFGKCAFFLILNDEDGKSEIIENPGNTIQGCKADVIVSKLAEKKISRVIAGDFGSNVQQVLNKKQIQMIINPDESVTVSDLISLLTIKSR